MEYMRANLNFGHIKDARIGDSMHFHVYDMTSADQKTWRLELASRFSTDAGGVAQALGLQANAKIDLETIIALLEEKISHATLFDVAHSARPVSDVAPTTPPS